jgi:hypothetical protein
LESLGFPLQERQLLCAAHELHRAHVDNLRALCRTQPHVRALLPRTAPLLEALEAALANALSYVALDCVPHSSSARLNILADGLRAEGADEALVQSLLAAPELLSGHFEMRVALFELINITHKVLPRGLRIPAVFASAAREALSAIIVAEPITELELERVRLHCPEAPFGSLQTLADAASLPNEWRFLLPPIVEELRAIHDPRYVQIITGGDQGNFYYLTPRRPTTPQNHGCFHETVPSAPTLHRP